VLLVGDSIMMMGLFGSNGKIFALVKKLGCGAVIAVRKIAKMNVSANIFLFMSNQISYPVQYWGCFCCKSVLVKVS